jgi:predicted ATP-dependent serine protease
MSALRDCQCGGEATLSHGHAPGAGNACAAWCLDCGATGPADEGKGDAVKGWSDMMEERMPDQNTEGRDLSPAMQRTIDKFRQHVAQRERERVRVATEQIEGLRDLARRDQGGADG